MSDMQHYYSTSKMPPEDRLSLSSTPERQMTTHKWCVSTEPIKLRLEHVSFCLIDTTSKVIQEYNQTDPYSVRWP